MTEAAIALRGPSVAMINSAVHSFTEQSRAFFLQQTGDPVVSRELAGRHSRICASSEPRP